MKNKLNNYNKYFLSLRLAYMEEVEEDVDVQNFLRNNKRFYSAQEAVDFFKNELGLGPNDPWKLKEYANIRMISDVFVETMKIQGRDHLMLTFIKANTGGFKISIDEDALKKKTFNINKDNKTITMEDL